LRGLRVAEISRGAGTMHVMVEMNSSTDGPAPRARARLAALLALALLAAPAHAGMLYKSIGPNGVVQFSDTPPANGVVVEQRPTGIVAAAAPALGATSALYPSAGPASNPLVALGDGSGDDEALARANAQVDLAEHALALARRALDADSARLRLKEAARAHTDDDRIAFYEHDLKLARNNLIEMLKARRATLAAAAAEPGAPILGPLRRLASR
jgi:uncharacterized protein DUF4124